ncbi:MAG: NAD(P)H-dependent oxidoreductase [Sphingomonas bacterium]
MTATGPNAAHPPRHVVVLGHPTPGSFNHAIAERYCATVRKCGQEATIRDLYALDFDPRLHTNRIPGHQTAMSADVAREIGFLREAEAIILVYPIWFGMPPAIIKGYVDRVMGAGLTPGAIKDAIPDSILHHKGFGSFSSSATTEIWLDEVGQMESVRRAFDGYLMKVFGMRDIGHVHFGAVVEGMSEAFAGQNLRDVEDHATKICRAVEEAHCAEAGSAINAGHS